MSLVKQLILALTLLMVLAFGGSFWVSLESARGQMQTQLAAHAQDAATALGLSLAPHVGDPTMSELMVNAIFDSGYFSRIRVERLEDGSALAEREQPGSVGRAPDWFAERVDLRGQTGEAIVMRGWQQYARVQVNSDPRFALERLWETALAMAGWLALCGLLGAVAGVWLLRRQLRPLRSLAVQAEAVGRREYRIQNNVPRTRELRPLVIAMNQMVARLRRVMEAESRRTEAYRRQAYEDPLTRLPNRFAFEHALGAALNSDDDEAGLILVARFPDLAALNHTQGAERVDSWLLRLAEALQPVQRQHPRWTVARVRAGEFMLLAPGAREEEIRSIASALSLGLDETPLELGIAAYREGQAPGQVLKQADLAVSESRRELNVVTPGVALDVVSASHRDPDTWRRLIEEALRSNGFLPHFQPVVRSGQDRPVHHKLLVRLALGDQMIPAGQLLPWVVRFGLGTRFDLHVLSVALEHLRLHQSSTLAVSLTAETLTTDGALDELARRLAARRDEASRLILEVDARQLLTLEPLDDLIWLVKPFETRVGLQHFGRSLTLIGELALLGLAYLKLDSTFLRDVDTQPEKHTYLRVLVDAAATAELPLIAEQVQTEAERATLEALGIHSWQGFAVGEPVAWAG